MAQIAEKRQHESDRDEETQPQRKRKRRHHRHHETDEEAQDRVNQGEKAIFDSLSHTVRPNVIAPQPPEVQARMKLGLAEMPAVSTPSITGPRRHLPRGDVVDRFPNMRATSYGKANGVLTSPSVNGTMTAATNPARDLVQQAMTAALAEHHGVRPAATASVVDKSRATWPDSDKHPVFNDQGIPMDEQGRARFDMLVAAQDQMRDAYNSTMRPVEASLVLPEIPVVSRSYEELFLRAPRMDLGERPCARGRFCEGVRMADSPYAGHDPSHGFVLREFLRPEMDLDFRTGKGLPVDRQLCLLCNRYFTTLTVLARISNGHTTREVVQSHRVLVGVESEYAVDACLQTAESYGLPCPQIFYARTNYTYTKNADGSLRIDQIGLAHKGPSRSMGNDGRPSDFRVPPAPFRRLSDTPEALLVATYAAPEPLSTAESLVIRPNLLYASETVNVWPDDWTHPATFRSFVEVVDALRNRSLKYIETGQRCSVLEMDTVENHETCRSAWREWDPPPLHRLPAEQTLIARAARHRINAARKAMNDPRTDKKMMRFLHVFMNMHVPLCARMDTHASYLDTEEPARTVMTMCRSGMTDGFKKDVDAEPHPFFPCWPLAFHEGEMPDASVSLPLVDFWEKRHFQRLAVIHALGKARPARCLVRGMSTISARYYEHVPAYLCLVRLLVYASLMGIYANASVRPPMMLQIMIYNTFFTTSNTVMREWLKRKQNSHLVFHAPKDWLFMMARNSPSVYEVLCRTYDWTGFETYETQLMDNARALLIRHCQPVHTPLPNWFLSAYNQLPAQRSSLGTTLLQAFHLLQQFQQTAHDMERQRLTLPTPMEGAGVFETSSVIRDPRLDTAHVPLCMDDMANAWHAIGDMFNQRDKEHNEFNRKARNHRLLDALVIACNRIEDDLYRYHNIPPLELPSIVAKRLKVITKLMDPYQAIDLSWTREAPINLSDHAYMGILVPMLHAYDEGCQDSALITYLQRLDKYDYAVFAHFIRWARDARRVRIFPLSTSIAMAQATALRRRFNLMPYEPLPDHLGSIWVCTACNTIHSVIVDRVKRVFQTGIIKAIYNPFLDKAAEEQKRKQAELEEALKEAAEAEDADGAKAAAAHQDKDDRPDYNPNPTEADYVDAANLYERMNKTTSDTAGAKAMVQYLEMTSGSVDELTKRRNDEQRRQRPFQAARERLSYVLDWQLPEDLYWYKLTFYGFDQGSSTPVPLPHGYAYFQAGDDEHATIKAQVLFADRGHLKGLTAEDKGVFRTWRFSPHVANSPLQRLLRRPTTLLNILEWLYMRCKVTRAADTDTHVATFAWEVPPLDAPFPASVAHKWTQLTAKLEGISTKEEETMTVLDVCPEDRAFEGVPPGLEFPVSKWRKDQWTPDQHAAAPSSNKQANDQPWAVVDLLNCNYDKIEGYHARTYLMIYMPYDPKTESWSMGQTYSYRAFHDQHAVHKAMLIFGLHAEGRVPESASPDTSEELHALRKLQYEFRDPCAYSWYQRTYARMDDDEDVIGEVYWEPFFDDDETQWTVHPYHYARILRMPNSVLPTHEEEEAEPIREGIAERLMELSQEEGFPETVQTDGTLLYAVSNARFFIAFRVKAVAEAKLKARALLADEKAAQIRSRLTDTATETSVLHRLVPFPRSRVSNWETCWDMIYRNKDEEDHEWIWPGEAPYIVEPITENELMDWFHDDQKKGYHEDLFHPAVRNYLKGLRTDHVPWAEHLIFRGPVLAAITDTIDLGKMEGETKVYAVVPFSWNASAKRYLAQPINLTPLVFLAHTEEEAKLKGRAFFADQNNAYTERSMVFSYLYKFPRATANDALSRLYPTAQTPYPILEYLYRRVDMTALPSTNATPYYSGHKLGAPLMRYTWKEGTLDEFVHEEDHFCLVPVLEDLGVFTNQKYVVASRRRGPTNLPMSDIDRRRKSKGDVLPVHTSAEAELVRKMHYGDQCAHTELTRVNMVGCYLEAFKKTYVQCTRCAGITEFNPIKFNGIHLECMNCEKTAGSMPVETTPMDALFLPPTQVTPSVPVEENTEMEDAIDVPRCFHCDAIKEDGEGWGTYQIFDDRVGEQRRCTVYVCPFDNPKNAGRMLSKDTQLWRSSLQDMINRHVTARMGRVSTSAHIAARNHYSVPNRVRRRRK